MEDACQSRASRAANLCHHRRALQAFPVIAKLCWHPAEAGRSCSGTLSIAQAVAEVERRKGKDIPQLDPVEDMRIESSSFRKAQRSELALPPRLPAC